LNLEFWWILPNYGKGSTCLSRSLNILLRSGCFWIFLFIETYHYLFDCISPSNCCWLNLEGKFLIKLFIQWCLFEDDLKLEKKCSFSKKRKKFKRFNKVRNELFNKLIANWAIRSVFKILWKTFKAKHMLIFVDNKRFDGFIEIHSTN
jgi:hypothetical protein